MPGHYDTNKYSITKNAWSCAGFANFAEWYICAADYNDKVKVKCVKQNVKFNYKNMKKYAKPGDVLRCDGHHSVVVYSIGKKSVKVIDNNWSHHCKISVHKVSYSSFSKVGITRGKKVY